MESCLIKQNGVFDRRAPNAYCCCTAKTGKLHVPCRLWSKGQHTERETALARGPYQAGPVKVLNIAETCLFPESFRGANGYPELVDVPVQN
jgi:hypothetical protein